MVLLSTTNVTCDERANTGFVPHILKHIQHSKGQCGLEYPRHQQPKRLRARMKGRKGIGRETAGRIIHAPKDLGRLSV